MAQTFTGMERSLTVSILNNSTAGTLRYSGLDAFANYKKISDYELAIMSLEDFQARLAAFQSYLEDLIPGLNFKEQTIRPARRENTGNCPIGSVAP
jgi:hypothetical protein